MSNLTNTKGKCEVCGQDQRLVNRIDSGQLVCATCLRQLRGARAAKHPARFKAAFKITIRWVAVVPVAILTALLVHFPIHWFLVIMKLLGTIRAPDGILATFPLEPVERLGVAFFVPFVFVVVGGRVAPTYRFHVAIALSCVFLLILTGYWVYIPLSETIDFENPVMAVCATSLNLIGVGAGLLCLRGSLEPAGSPFTLR